MKFRLLPVHALISAITAALITSAFGLPAGAITVRPAGLDHLAVSVPADVKAGEEFRIRLEAYDAHNNLITNFSETGRDIQASVSGSAEARPQIIRASSFASGAAEFTVYNKKAEKIVVSLTEAGATVPIFTKEIIISPNRLDHFTVSAPPSIQAGKRFDVKVWAKDAFENTVKDEAMSGDVKVSSSGKTELRAEGALAFKDGMALISVSADKTGTAALEVRDVVKGVAGRSGEVAITPGPLEKFAVSAPAEVEAGKAFEISVTALDSFGNSAYDYGTYGAGVNLYSSGRGSISPAFVKASEFKEGSARVSVAYEKAEDMTITAVENNRPQKGISASVRVAPGNLEKLVIVTPEDAVAGQKFAIRLEAYDRFDNLIKDYNLRGSDVALTASGRGSLTPSVVAASEFAGGIATVEVSYDRAEALTIASSVLTRTETAKKEKRAEPKKEEKKKPEKEAKAQKKEEPVKAVAKKEEAPKAKPEEAKAEKPEKEAKAEKIEKAEKPAEKPVAPVAKAEKPAGKPAERPARTAKVFEVTDVNIIEARNKALLVLSVPGISSDFEWKEGLESTGGKDWVRLRLKPVSSKVKKALSFKSEFIGGVKLREGASGEVDLLFELLPAKVKYDVKRAEDALIISISPF